MSTSTNNNVDNRRSTLERLNLLLMNDPTYAARVNHEAVEEGVLTASKQQEDQHEALHTLLATNGSFTEEVSHSIVNECIKDQKMSQQGRTDLSRANLYETKDAFLPAPKSEKGAYTPPQANLTGQIKLPAPGSINGNNPWWGDNSDDISIIAVLNQVLTVCAKASSDFWKNMWEQATSNMMNAIALAKPISDAVSAQWNAQADATYAEAKMNESDGTLKCIFAGLSFAGGMKESFFPKEDPNLPSGIGTNKIGADAEDALDDTGKAAAEDPVAAQADATEQSQVRQAASQPAPANEGSGGAKALSSPNASATASASRADSTAARDDVERISRGDARSANAPRGPADPADPARDPAASARAPVKVGGSAPEQQSSLKPGAKAVFARANTFKDKVWQGFLKGFQMATGMGLMADGICGVAYDAPGKKDMSAAQRQAGNYDATSKEGEMIAQFQNQAFGRAEDVRQGGQQNIDFGMNVMKSAADTITQAVLAQHV